MVFMGDGGAEQRHEAITEELVDGAFIAVDHLERQCEEPIQQGVHVFWSNPLGNRSRIGKIAE
jgi:hypothetical protein